MSDHTSKAQSREQYWRMHIEQARAMGMRYTDYARQHDLKLGTLYSWSKRFRQGGSEKTGQPTFASVRVIEECDLQSICRCQLANGVILELEMPRNSAELEQLLALLSRLP